MRRKCVKVSLHIFVTFFIINYFRIPTKWAILTSSVSTNQPFNKHQQLSPLLPEMSNLSSISDDNKFQGLQTNEKEVKILVIYLLR